MIYMIKSIINKLSLFIFFGFILIGFNSCAASSLEKKSVSVTEQWNFQEGDNPAWAAVSYNDSSWQSRDSLSGIQFSSQGNYFWVRANVVLPQNVSADDLWLGFKKFNACADVYVNGVYIGSRGKFPPATNIKIEEEKDILVPPALIKGNKFLLAIRFYLPGNALTNPDIHFDNGDQAYFQMNVKSVFNQKLFIMLAVVSLFFIIYSLLQYLVDDKNISYIYFILSVFFIALYFYDLGAQNQIFDYNIQRSLFRCCLGIGMCFLLLFLNRFFNRKHYKLMLIICITTALTLLILFMANSGKDLVIENLFLVALIVVVASIVYGFICTITAIKQGQKDVIPILIGFIVGTAIAIHDIIYQIIGKVPFMWIQGIAFFVLDLSIFIALAIRQFQSKHRVQKLAEETARQKENLRQIIENAQRLVNDSNQIAAALNDSVKLVVNASDQTQAKISDINNAIIEQTRIREETDKAVHNLTDFLNNISKEFETETEVISNTVSKTQEVIQGISTVGEGVSSAAEFTSSLSSLTSVSSQETKQLIQVMDQVQASSNEILGVVTTLDTFANKIDLLSMNASIEAAHSGIAGKGFSVIAHEIKNLANQTQQWSSKIGEIITSVINSIQESARMAKRLDSALGKINEDSIISAEKVNSASEGMKMQKQAGEIITQESQVLYQSANKMQNEVKTQSSFSAQVLGNMESLFNASCSVNAASDEIVKESEILSLEANKLRELAERTTVSAQELLKVMNQQ